MAVNSNEEVDGLIKIKQEVEENIHEGSDINSYSKFSEVFIKVEPLEVVENLKGNESQNEIKVELEPKLDIKSEDVDITRDESNCIEHVKGFHLERSNCEIKSAEFQPDTTTMNEGLFHEETSSLQGQKIKKRSPRASRAYCKICEKDYSNSNFAAHMRTHSGVKPYVCNLCNKGFTTYFQLMNHTRVHSGEKPFACNVCDKKFSEKSNLSKHMLLHSENERFLCDVCDMKFRLKSDLNKHNVTVHLGGNLYKCNVCLKSLTTKLSLVNHRRIHTKEKPFACNVCNQTFCATSALNKHMRIHTMEKPYTCYICDCKFSYKSDLNKHMKRKHEEEKAYACNICLKTFSEKLTLMNHVRSHTGERTFN